jgi:hypothetical protein
MSNRIRLRKPDLVLPAGTTTLRAKRGTELVDLRALGIVPGIAGGARGFNAFGDIIKATIDGTDLNELWNDFNGPNGALAQYNDAHDSLRSMLSFHTTLPAEEVARVGALATFEDASEYGTPQGTRIKPDVDKRGAGFRFRDLAIRMTWQYLANATAQQVQAVQNTLLEADHRQVFDAVMGRLFRGNTNGVNPEGFTIFGLYNNDGETPPDYAGNTFLNTHTHYLASGAAVVDGQDLAAGIAHHGYTDVPGTQLLIFANKVEMDVIRGFKAGVGTVPSPFDFIPAQGSPTYLTTQQIVGDIPPAAYGRIKIAGSFGPAWCSENAFIPAGYVLTVVSGGAESQVNPIVFREHVNGALRGLLNIGGSSPDYPLIDSFAIRGFGTGVRHRGAAVVMQITAGAYAAPSIGIGLP